ncbi:polysaccharide biosynthesis/export family protein [Mucilaginibacter boryungensis]|uniref:Polysaccharide export protein n=1 Tax=Mucilaginibacter boryungensis TaxID=768480 RepID=A0ABR9XHW8_9SPHI|nr:polysaccharide biosynthesis/export family protein [Mucilaginibacter boryungensis]MBE9666815.1 polysaccharide export protein [Mucilaginibacter boryungensis]
MKNTIIQTTLLAFSLILSSCSFFRDKGVFKDSGYQNVSYFQNADHSGYFEEKINNYAPFKIQSGDILGINVNSVNQEAASVFNTSTNRVNGASPDAINPVYGFKVDVNGNVQLPLVGDMKVAGMTTDEVAKKLTSNLLPYLKNPIVNIRVLNFKVSVFGDVLRPNVYNIQNERININEVISLAGDLNITANRKNILLVREEDGKRMYYTIDLTKKDLFDSPYYYLHNNDVIYVDPDKTKYDTVSRSYKRTTITLSALSIAAVVLSAMFIYYR